MSTRITGAELNFANLLKPKAFEDQAPKFSVMVVIPADDPQVEAIEKAIEEVKVEKWGAKATKMPKLKSPLKYSPLISGKGDEVIPEGFVYMTASTKYDENRPNNNRPVIVDSKLNPLDSPNDVFSGCIGNVSVNLGAYDLKINKGVAAYLQGVQITAKGKRKDGGTPEASSIFGEVKDGFTRDAGDFDVEDEI
jgi:hypothetical protein